MTPTRADLRRRYSMLGDVLWGVARGVSGLAFGRAVVRLHERLGAPPVLFETFDYVSLWALLVRRAFLPGPRLCIFHDTNFDFRHASPIAAAYKRIVRPLAAGILARMDRVFVHGEDLLENLLQQLDPSRLSADRVAVLPFGSPHPDDVGRIGREEARRALGLPVPGRVALAFGTLRSDKEIAATVEGVALAGGWRLLVAGMEGDVSFTQIRRVATQAGLGERLHIREGFVPPSEHAAFFGAADVVVSLYSPEARHESGTANLARSFLRPVIVGGLPDLVRFVRDQGVGWTVDPPTASGLAAVLETITRASAEEWETLERRIWATAEECSWDRVARIVTDAIVDAPRSR